MAQTIYLVRGLEVPERAFRTRAGAEQYSSVKLPLSANPFSRCFLWKDRNSLALFPLFFNDRSLTDYMEYGDCSFCDLYWAFHGEEPTGMPFPVAPSDQPQPHILTLTELANLAQELGLELPEVSGEQEVEPWYTWWEEAKTGLTEKQQHYFWSRVLPHPHAIVELEWEE